MLLNGFFYTDRAECGYQSHSITQTCTLDFSFTFQEKKNKILFPPSFEPGTFCVLGERDNDYTTGTN